MLNYDVACRPEGHMYKDKKVDNYFDMHRYPVLWTLFRIEVFEVEMDTSTQFVACVHE